MENIEEETAFYKANRDLGVKIATVQGALASPQSQRGEAPVEWICTILGLSGQQTSAGNSGKSCWHFVPDLENSAARYF